MADSSSEWKELGAQLRIDSIRCTTAAGSGHPTSSMSAADLMAVLLQCQDWEEDHDPEGRELPRAKRHDDKSLAVAAFGPVQPDLDVPTCACLAVGDNFLHGFKGTPSERQAVRP